MAGVKGAGGPPPKRSDQRRRRNKVDGLEQAIVDGAVRGPELEGDHTPQAMRLWEALRRSGQAQFYEPSDWAAAELLIMAVDSFVNRPSAMMLASVNSMMTTLLVTEGDRRRARLELERAPASSEPTDDVPDLNAYRKRLSGRAS